MLQDLEVIVFLGHTTHTCLTNPCCWFCTNCSCSNRERMLGLLSKPEQQSKLPALGASKQSLLDELIHYFSPLRPQSCLRRSRTPSLWTTGASAPWCLSAAAASGRSYTICSPSSGRLGGKGDIWWHQSQQTWTKLFSNKYCFINLFTIFILYGLLMPLWIGDREEGCKRGKDIIFPLA